MVIWDGCQHVKKNCKTIDLRGAQVNNAERVPNIIMMIMISGCLSVDIAAAIQCVFILNQVYHMLCAKSYNRFGLICNPIQSNNKDCILLGIFCRICPVISEVYGTPKGTLKPIFWYQKMIFWYQKIGISDIKKYMNFWYKKSYLFSDIRKWFSGIRN